MGQVSGVVSCPSVCACSSLGWDGSSQAPSDWLVLCPSLSPYPLPSSPTYFLHTAIPFTNPPSIYCLSSVLFIHSYTHPPNLPSIHPSLQVLICSLHSLLFYPFIHSSTRPTNLSSFLPSFPPLLLPPSFPSLSPSPFLLSFLLSFLLPTQSSIQPSLYPSENCLDHPIIHPTNNIFFILYLSLHYFLLSLPAFHPSVCLRDHLTV